MMKYILSAIVFFCINTIAFGQHLFTKKYDNCNIGFFCWDCGDQKVQVDSVKFDAMIKDLNHRVYVNNLKGSVLVQMLIDSAGKGCVLSHSETKGLTFSEKMVWALNDFTGWKPAITNSKPEPKVSIIIQFLIDNGKISGRLVRITKEMKEAIEKKF